MYTLGESRERPTVIFAPSLALFSTPSAEWQVPSIRDGLERLAVRRRVVKLDVRGTGLSTRNVTDVSIEAVLDDLRAVAEQASDAPVDIIAPTIGGPFGIAFAARRHDHVRRLVLWNAVARGRDFRTPLLWRVTAPIADVDLEFFLRVRAMQSYGWTETARRLVEASKDAVSLETINSLWRSWRGSDATDLLPHVRCPTLVVHYAGGEMIPMESAKIAAATIPHARLVLSAKAAPVPLLFADDLEEDLRMILGFLDEDAPAAVVRGLPEGTAVILFADIVDSTLQTERMGDAAFRSHAREVDVHLRAIIRDHRGMLVEGKVLGDGVMAVFTSTARAIECATACHNATLGSELLLRIGLHAGDVIPEDDNVYGGAVNIASRICGLCAPGEILVSATVRDLARTSAGVTFEDRGEQVLKGVSDAVRVFAVRPTSNI